MALLVYGMLIACCFLYVVGVMFIIRSIMKLIYK